MLDPRLHLLADYPFDRLRALLNGIEPPKVEPLVLSVGEPRHSPSPLVHEILAANSGSWGVIRPSREHTGVSCRRRGLAEPALRPSRGTDRRGPAYPAGRGDPRGSLYLIAAVAIPEAREGGRPLVLMPNPFYPVYFGAAVMSGADPEVSARDAGNRASSGSRPGLRPGDTGTNGAHVPVLSGKPAGGAPIAHTWRMPSASRGASTSSWRSTNATATFTAVNRPAAPWKCAALGEDLGNVVVFHSLSEALVQRAGLRWASWPAIRS